ncbi:hypothetical protein [Paenibacillus sp. FSL K6-2524]|uniref:hypothetical protein n=1 Tax=Paenibacillus sp. FSL K6-2524 TaxID=2954516 RepID=UPI0030FCD70F
MKRLNTKKKCLDTKISEQPLIEWTPLRVGGFLQSLLKPYFLNKKGLSVEIGL